MLAACALTLAVTGLAQSAPPASENQEANLKAYVEMLRKDIRKEKVAILTELLQLTPEESARFWPVYKEYDSALTRLADERIAYIRMYAENYAQLTDGKTAEIANGLIDVEARRTQLKKQYFQRMSQTVSVKQAARFLQVENQIEKLIDLQISASLPIVE
jgi:hypothetical protein